MSLPAECHLILGLRKTTDDCSEPTGYQGIYPRKHLALIDPRDQGLGLQLNQSGHPGSQQIQESKANMLEESTHSPHHNEIIYHHVCME